MRYRRAQVEGGTFFFTVNLANRNSRLLTDNIATLRTVIRTVRQRPPFEIVAMVVLPDHLHAICEMPKGDANYPMRWSLIKSGFSRAISRNELVGPSRYLKRERGIWQRRYWEHQIRDEADLERHAVYIQGVST